MQIGRRSSSVHVFTHALTPRKGRCHTAVAAGHSILYFGGSLPSTNCLSVLDTRTFTSREVRLRGQSVQRRLSHCAAVVDASMIVVGGWSVDNQRASETLRDCFTIDAAVSDARAWLIVTLRHRSASSEAMLKSQVRLRKATTRRRFPTMPMTVRAFLRLSSPFSHATCAQRRTCAGSSSRCWLFFGKQQAATVRCVCCFERARRHAL